MNCPNCDSGRAQPNIVAASDDPLVENWYCPECGAAWVIKHNPDAGPWIVAIQVALGPDGWHVLVKRDEELLEDIPCSSETQAKKIVDDLVRMAREVGGQVRE